MNGTKAEAWTEETRSVGSGRLAFIRTGGDRGAVLLVHGNSSCKEIFAHQISFLADRGYDVVAADLPGHGNSDDAPNPPDTYSFPGYARALSNLMEQLGVGAYHVVGWSLGGHIGLEMWSTLKAVRSLLITGTPPVRLSPDGAAEGFLPSATMDLAGKACFSEADVLAYGSAMLGTDIDRTSHLACCIARTHGEARRLMLQNGLAGIGQDEVVAVRECAKPLAIVQGKNDPFVNVSYLHRLTYKNLWLKNPTIVNGGHAPHWMQAVQFNNYLGEFIELTSGSGGII
ncbi:alpha/beta fold hydrolase [Bradyrhizobium japonicum]|uniref:alpha/beta fold hydrolase n=1 Tax=Bradyrhizobium japonicum TaxID=375 RepID=UPI001BA6DC42|nr:alpha/beta hydrolase [Bradyrhizobium japonicum]MBR0911480.1 alpha/beta hydrolase [Bradyrhizobium japonicum]